MPAVAKNIQTWSRTAASNVQANTGFTMDEGMSPAAVNNSVRAIMASLKELHDAFASTQGILLTNNASATNAWAMTAFYTPRDTTNDADALTSGQVYFGLAPTTVTSTLTLAINGGTAKPVLWNNAALATGIIAANDPFLVYYDGTSQHILLIDKFAPGLTAISTAIHPSIDGALTLGLAAKRFSTVFASAISDGAAATSGIISSVGTQIDHGKGSAWTTQVFYAGGVQVCSMTNDKELRLDGTPTTISRDSAGFRGAPVDTHDANYTLVSNDSGRTMYHTSASTHTWTIPANASVPYADGTIVRMDNENGGGAVTIAITTDTMRWGSSTGSRTLAANGTAFIQKMTATSWRMTGTGVT